MYRNQKILDLPKGGDIECQYCGADDGTVVAAHSNHQEHGKGLGIKAHDCFVGYLCARCHSFVDQGGGSGFVRDAVWRIAHESSIPLFKHLLDEYGVRLLADDWERRQP